MSSETTDGVDRLLFVVPLPPNMANSRMHWRTKERFRADYFARLDFMYAARMLPRVPVTGTWASATVRADLHMPNAMDEDNSVARCKWPLDWIVRKGYLQDDNRKALKWESFPAQTLTRVKAEPQVIHLTLTRGVESDTSART